VSAGSETHVSLFDANATGDAAPLLTIQGPSTTLEGKVVTGIVESQQTGELFVLAKSAQFGAGQVCVYSSSARDDAAPVRTFTDASSQLTNAAGMGIGYESVAVGATPTPPGTVFLLVGPNPVRGVANVRLTLPRAVRGLRLQVFDSTGRLFATIWKGDAPAGTIETRWDGRSESGPAPAGLYFIRATGEGLKESGRIVLLR
jgi:hypothetical protein